MKTNAPGVLVSADTLDDESLCLRNNLQAGSHEDDGDNHSDNDPERRIAPVEFGFGKKT